MLSMDYLIHCFYENNRECGIIFYFIFVFGHFAITLLSAFMCFLTKDFFLIQLYDFFGFILGSSVIAIFANLVLLMPLVFLGFDSKPIFYCGIVITIVCYCVIMFNFSTLNKMGKNMSNKKR